MNPADARCELACDLSIRARNNMTQLRNFGFLLDCRGTIFQTACIIGRVHFYKNDISREMVPLGLYFSNKHGPYLKYNPNRHMAAIFKMAALKADKIVEVYVSRNI